MCAIGSGVETADQGAQLEFDVVLVFQVVYTEPSRSTAQSCNRLSESGATATSSTGFFGVAKVDHDAHAELEFVETFQVENNNPLSLTAQSCSRRSLSAATATFVTINR